MDSQIPKAETLARPRNGKGPSAIFNLHETCLSEGVPAGDLDRFGKIAFARRLLRTGDRLFCPGDAFTCIYSIHSGSFKTTLVDGNGREQVMGFYMPDELLGMDGMGSGSYNVRAIALEDSDVWAMPQALIEAMARETPALQRRLHSVLASEIVRNQDSMMLLGSMCAHERLAAFLLDMSRRFARRGYSGSSFRLVMTRADIGSYLGLSLETVSRLLSGFQRMGLINVRLRDISILDMQGLELVVRADGDTSLSAAPRDMGETASCFPMSPVPA